MWQENDADQKLCPVKCLIFIEITMMEKREDVESGLVTFSPALYLQRYHFTYDLLLKENQRIVKMADFGCAEGKFFRIIKKLPFAEEINLVDVSKQALEEAEYEARPLLWDHVFGRFVELKVKMYIGSVSDPDSRLTNLDAITCIELIEHLPQDVLELFGPNVFGYLRPRLVIVTTPNREFNALFPQLSDGSFRHWDHKFEWTRDEFQKWCHGICLSYPDYAFEITGVGLPPEQFAHLGFCSQIAIFRKKENQSVAQNLPESIRYKNFAQFHFPKRDESMPKVPEIKPFDWNISEEKAIEADEVFNEEDHNLDTTECE